MISSNRRLLKDLYDVRKRREIKTSDPVNKSKMGNISYLVVGIFLFILAGISVQLWSVLGCLYVLAGSNVRHFVKQLERSQLQSLDIRKKLTVNATCINQLNRSSTCLQTKC